MVLALPARRKMAKLEEVSSLLEQWPPAAAIAAFLPSCPACGLRHDSGNLRGLCRGSAGALEVANDQLASVVCVHPGGREIPLTKTDHQAGQVADSNPLHRWAAQRAHAFQVDKMHADAAVFGETGQDIGTLQIPLAKRGAVKLGDFVAEGPPHRTLEPRMFRAIECSEARQEEFPQGGGVNGLEDEKAAPHQALLAVFDERKR